jgi:hypothetical protein
MTQRTNKEYTVMAIAPWLHTVARDSMVRLVRSQSIAEYIFFDYWSIDGQIDKMRCQDLVNALECWETAKEQDKCVYIITEDPFTVVLEPDGSMHDFFTFLESGGL